ncbi:MAG: hypothetical protein QNJ68_02815 [Microcoleaceae cyanobacterium MO_207.B10]|nr:hypothetical protein [Microcoleaceae cyanobacterium MO_207.B10]
MKQLSLPIDIPETIPQMTIGDRCKFEAIKAISPNDICAVSLEEPEQNFTPEPEWDAQWFGSFWVQFSPLLIVLHPTTGNSISFYGDDTDLPEIADKIAHILK